MLINNVDPDSARNMERSIENESVVFIYWKSSHGAFGIGTGLDRTRQNRTGQNRTGQLFSVW